MNKTVTPLQIATATANATTSPVRVIHWEAMEPEWMAGIVSKKELGRRYGVSRPAIEKHWAKAGVKRDLIAKIQAKADALVSQQAAALSAARRAAPARRIMEREIVDANGTLQASIRTGHRTLIARCLVICESLVAELEAQNINVEPLQQLGDSMRDPESNSDKVNEMFKKIISTPGRVDTAKKLVETVKSVVAMEREAYGIDVGPAEVAGGSIAAFLAGMKRSALPVVVDVSEDDGLL
jgi:hypothetical protein